MEKWWDALKEKDELSDQVKDFEGKLAQQKDAYNELQSAFDHYKKHQKGPEKAEVAQNVDSLNKTIATLRRLCHGSRDDKEEALVSYAQLEAQLKESEKARLALHSKSQ